MILPGLVYKSSSLPPISEHFLPQSNSGWSYSCRSRRGLAATILKRENHLLVLQYKCKYGHLRTAGLWIMEAGCPWYSWEGERSATQKQREKAHNLTLYFSFPRCRFAHTASDPGQKWDSSSNAAGCCRPLVESTFLFLSLFFFYLRDASKMLLERDLLQFAAINK